MRYLLFLASALTLLLFVGCKTDAYYQDRAVENARAYLFKNAPELSLEQREYVRFNKPRLLHALTGVSTPGQFLTTEQTQICVTWIIPDRPHYYMVAGLSDSSMRSWAPNRLIRKSFPTDMRNLFAVEDKARAYVYRSVYNLLPRDAANEVRWSEPEIFLSAFEPELGIDVTDPDERAALLRDFANQTQLAVVWRWPSDPEHLTIVFGYGNPDLSRWNAQSGGVFTVADLDGRLLEKREFKVDK